MAVSGSHTQHPAQNGTGRGSEGPGVAGQHFTMSAGGTGTFPSRTATPGTSSFVGGGRVAGQYQDIPAGGPSMATPRTMPPHPPRFTSPQPVGDRSGRPSSPSKRTPHAKFPNAPDARERWSSIGQVQNAQHQPPPFEPRYSNPSADGQYLAYGHERAPGFPSDDGHHRDAPQEFSQGFREAQFVGYDQGPPGYFSHPNAPSGSMSPRSQMHFQQQQQQQQQSQRAQQQPPPLQQSRQPSQPHLMPPHHQHHQQQQQALQHQPQPPPPPAGNVGSGLVSSSGQPVEEITTIFIVGFPDDMTEREFANMFLFARGFEASTLKVPGGGPLPVAGGDASRPAGRSEGPGGPGGPYHAVMPGNNLFDMPTNPGWDEQALNAALGRQGNDPTFSLSGLNIGESGPRGGGPPNAANAGKVKQTIGFAKFRSRAEALEARDALNGKRVDSDRGCVLKTEMAKKNLHTKQRLVLPGGGQGPFTLTEGGGGSSFGFDGPRSAGASVTSPFPSSFPPNGGQSSFDAFARAGGPPSSTLSTLSGMISPQGQNEPFGADFLRATPAASGMSSTTRSGSGGEAGSGDGGSGSKWSSMGPLDYFGPPSEPEGEAHSAQLSRQRQAAPDVSSGNTSAGAARTSFQPPPPINTSVSSGPTVAHRGPDWSAIGSPPSVASGGGGSLFAGARPFASTKEKSSISSSAPPFVPSSSVSRQVLDEDFGQGESTMSAMKTKKEELDEEESKRDTTASSLATDVAAGSTHSPASRHVRGPSNASSSFAARFGSLRLDSPAITQAASNTATTTHTPPTGTTSAKGDNPVDKSRSGSDVKPSRSGASSHTASVISLPSSTSMMEARSPTLPELPNSPTGRSFSIDQNPPGNTLFVGNLPASVTSSLSTSLEKQLRARFSSQGGYRQLSYRLKNNGPMCFVEYDSVQNAARALAELNGDSMDGLVKNGGLRLSFSKNPLFRKDSHSTTSSSAASTSPQSPADHGSHISLGSLGKAGQSLRDDPLDSANKLEDSSFAQGFSAGSSHGRLHGLFEGRQLGREKGFEIWDEVGFYQGTARFWKGVLSTSGDKATRKVTKQLGHIEALERLIAAFPMKNKSGENISSSSVPTTYSLNGSPTKVDQGIVGEGDEDQLAPDATDEQLAEMDMASLLERIKARYKLMCASLGIPAKGTGEDFNNTNNNNNNNNSTTTTGAASNKTTTATIAGRAVDTTQLRF